MNDCIRWNGTMLPSGYGLGYADGRRYYAHRRVWEDAHGPIPSGMFVCHSCDNPSCINVAHLFLGTPRDNTQDMLRKGRQASGASHPHTRLTTGAVVIMRELYDNGVDEPILAAMFGVSRPYVSEIVTGAKRQSVGGPLAPRRRSGHMKVSADARQRIRQRRAEGASLKELAAEFHVVFQRISQICHE
jgi:HNH endonuclease